MYFVIWCFFYLRHFEYCIMMLMMMWIHTVATYFLTSDVLNPKNHARREPQQGPGKHSRGPPNIFTGPLWGKNFWIFRFRMVHSGVLVQRIQFAKDTDRMFENKLQQGRTRHFTKKIWQTWSTDQRHVAAGWNVRITKENETAGWTARPTEPVRLETNVSLNTPDTQRDGSNTV